MEASNSRGDRNRRDASYSRDNRDANNSRDHIKARMTAELGCPEQLKH
jgi:hypothetical protein